MFQSCAILFRLGEIRQAFAARVARNSERHLRETLKKPARGRDKRASSSRNSAHRARPSCPEGSRGVLEGLILSALRDFLPKERGLGIWRCAVGNDSRAASFSRPAKPGPEVSVDRERRRFGPDREIKAGAQAAAAGADPRSSPARERLAVSCGIRPLGHGLPGRPVSRPRKPIQRDFFPSSRRERRISSGARDPMLSGRRPEGSVRPVAKSLRRKTFLEKEIVHPTQERGQGLAGHPPPPRPDATGDGARRQPVPRGWSFSHQQALCGSARPTSVGNGWARAGYGPRASGSTTLGPLRQ